MSLSNQIASRELQVGAGRTGTPWALLSVDLSENEIGEMCGMRWAEVLAVHPTLQFLSLRRTALAVYHYDTFAGLCVAASTAPALSVLDLRDNFASNLSSGTHSSTIW